MEKGKGKVKEIQHDPGRTAPVALVEYEDKSRSLIIASSSLMEGQEIEIGDAAPLKIGNTRPIGEIPEGTMVFNIEVRPGDGGKLVRAGGTNAVVVSHGTKTVVQLPSGKFKNLNPKCRATIGAVAGGGHKEKPFAKAGKKFHANRSRAKKYPSVKGVCMNPVNHPHGGGGHRHVGGPSTASRHHPPGKKVGRLSSKKKSRKR
jgi:large subunit ribosomal protein L2